MVIFFGPFIFFIWSFFFRSFCFCLLTLSPISTPIFVIISPSIPTRCTVLETGFKPVFVFRNIQMPDLSVPFQGLVPIDSSPPEPHGRLPLRLPLRQLRDVIQNQFGLETSHKNSHRRKALLVSRLSLQVRY